MSGESRRDIVAQQVDTLALQLEYMQSRRLWYNACAAIPVVGWCGFAVLGALVMGNPIGAVAVLLLMIAVAGGLFIPQTIIQGLALTSAFAIAFFGWGLPMLVGGWVLMGWVVVVLVIAGLSACYTVVNNDINISRTQERLEELSPKYRRRNAK